MVASAILAGALYLAGAIALGSPPDATDSGQAVVAWFRDHDGAARFYAWSAALGTLGFCVSIGIVRSLLPSPHGYVFLLGAAAFVTETAVQAWIWAGLALHPATLEPATARLLYDVASFWGPILTGATTTMIAAVTVLGVGPRRQIPNWLTFLGAVAFAEQATESVTVFGTHGFIAPGGPMNLVLGAALTAAWFIAVVVWAARRMRAGDATRASA